MILDMDEIMNDLGSPHFTWNSVSYDCIASVAQYEKQLGDGGFTIAQLLTLTIPRYKSDGTPVFTLDVIPQAQQRITYQTKAYRIINVKEDSVFDVGANGARIRIVAESIQRGV